MDQTRKILSAASSGDVESMKDYVSSSSINAITDDEGSTPLMYAAANGHEKLVRLLIQAEGVDVDQKNCYGWTALLQASCYGHHEVVYTLLQAGAQINVGNSWGTTPLVAACQGCFIVIAQDLLNRGAGLNTADEVASVTPLMAAAQSGCEAIVEMLLNGGANPNARLSITGWTALMLAALNNHVGVVRLLLNGGAVREMRDVNNCRAIDLATNLKHDKVVSALSEDNAISSSMDVDIFDVVKQGNIEMLQEILTKYKVSVTVTDKDGATPLMFAARKSDTQICQLLIDSGADIDAQDYYHGWTAFMHAVHHKQHKVAKLLAENGANVTLRAKNGSSAFDIANLIGDVHMIKLIAQVTIQNMSKRDNIKIKLSVLDENEEDEISTDTVPEVSPSPPPPIISSQDDTVNDKEVKEDVSAEDILRRVSNAYLAGGAMPSNLLENPGLLRPQPLSPFSGRSPSPELEPHQILPAVTKQFQPRPVSPRSVSPRAVSPSPKAPPIIVPEQRTINNSRRDKKERQLPKLQFVYPPGAMNSVSKSRSFIPPPLPQSPLSPIKSPRSLPRNAFKFPPSSGPSRHSPSFPFPPPPQSNSFRRDINPFPMKQNKFPSFEITRTSGGRYKPSGNGGNFPGLPSHSRSKQSTKNTLQLNLKPAKFNSKGPDLKTALESASLSQYYPLLKEQEMDTYTFLILTEEDLIDMGVANHQDRSRLLALSNRLREIQSPRSPSSRSPKSPGNLGGHAFQYSLQ